MSENRIMKTIMNSIIILSLVNLGFIGVLTFEGIMDFDGVQAAKTIIVDCNGGGNYISIQDAVDAAKSGDTVRVWAGTYYENVIINKSINLIGNVSYNTIINGSGFGDVVTINSNGVKFENFSVTNSGNRIYQFYYEAGIRLDKVQNVSVNNCNCTNNLVGIFGYKSQNSRISNNTCNVNDRCGIIVSDSAFNIIEKNECYNNTNHGIVVMYDSQNNSITENDCQNNLGDGFIISYEARYNEVIHNNFSNNKFEGILIVGGSHNKVFNNTCNKNRDGILVDRSHNNEIFNNYLFKNNVNGVIIKSPSNNFFNNSCVNNKYGINISSFGSYNIIKNNLIKDNENGLTIFTMNNQIFNNLFINNNNHTYGSGYNNTWNVTYPIGGNYWDNWTSPDSDNDGFVDKPYIISGFSKDYLPLAKKNIATRNKKIIVDINGRGNFTKIQLAIDNASFGDIIYVWSGAYYENIVINKRLTLIGNGSDNTIIDGGCKGHVVKIIVDQVNFKGFLITGSGINWYSIKAGILLDSVENCTINNNTIMNCQCGILAYSQYCTISHNRLTKNGNGIGIGGSHNKIFNNTCKKNFGSGISAYGFHNRISNNTCDMNEIGIYYSLAYSSLENNICNYNYKDGIHTWSSRNTIIKNNNCSSNRKNGIYYSTTHPKAINNFVINNICKWNNGSGIDLNNARYLSLLNNSCENNEIGISLNYGSKNTVKNNSCSYNRKSHGIIIHHSNNNIIDNNTLNSNAVHGIFITASKSNIISNNSMKFCGLLINTQDFDRYYSRWTCNEIDNNSVNGKPLYHWENRTGGRIPQDAGAVILSNCQNVIIENQDLSNGSVGIFLIGSDKNIIRNNSCNSNKGYGIYFYISEFNIIENNTCNSNEIDGIYSVTYSNTFKNNTCNFNGENGIQAYSEHVFLNNTLKSNKNFGIYCPSGNRNILKNNTMISCGLYISGVSNNTIDSSNTVNGKPVCYLLNQQNQKVPPGRGQIVLIKCNNITIENQNLSNATIGVIIQFSREIYIRNCICNNNSYQGIYVGHSFSIVIEKNICNFNRGINGSLNWWDFNCGNGITIFNTGNNFLKDNICNFNKNHGIALRFANSCSIINNNCSDNAGGIVTSVSSSDKIYNNRLFNNAEGISISCSGGNSIFNNSLIHCGLSLTGTSNTQEWNSHTISINNTVNGKSVYYWVNKNGSKIPKDTGGVILVECKNITVENLTLNNSDVGIQIYKSHYNLIKNNVCNSNTGCGIFMLNSNYNKIVNNICNFNFNGISFAGEHNTFIKNTCKSNQNYGIITGWLGNNTYRNNFLIDNRIGIEFWDYEPEVAPVYKNSNNNFLNNTCMDNYYAIFIDASWGNNISNNNFSNNHYCIYFSSSDYCEWYVENRISNNNFISNHYPFDIYFFGEVANNINITKNFWSDYQGLDNGAHGRVKGDGIGDTFIAHKILDPNPLMNPVNIKLPPSPPILIDPGEFDPDGSYSIIWEERDSSFGFVLEEATTEFFDSSITVYNGSGSKFHVSGKINGTYYYRVKAFNKHGESSWSNIVDMVVDWPPDTPENLKVITYPSGNALNISWNPNLYDTIDYLIFSNASGDWSNFATISVPKRIYNHTGLIDGKLYYYKIQARDARGQVSEFSKIVKGIPWDSVPPAPPKGLEVTSTTNNLTYLEWQPNTEDDLEGYKIYRSKKQNPRSWGKPIDSVGSGIEQYMDLNLEEMTTYYYVITAFDDVPNESGFSNIASGTTIMDQYGPELNNSVKDFAILEDHIDDSTINLYKWFKDKNNDPMVFYCNGSKNIKVYIFQKNGSVMLIPAKDWSGQETLTFTASDGIFNVSDDVTITIIPVNDPPGPAVITSPTNNYRGKVGTPLNFSAICLDPDISYGDELSYFWYSNISDVFGERQNLTDIVLPVGFHQITVYVFDLADEYCSNSINITIFTVSTEPENVTPSPNQTNPGIPPQFNNTKPKKDEQDKISSEIVNGTIIVIIAIVILLVFILIVTKKDIHPIRELKNIMFRSKKDHENNSEPKPPPNENPKS
jgi:parallel beta-helix repeat protein